MVVSIPIVGAGYRPPPACRPAARHPTVQPAGEGAHPAVGAQHPSRNAPIRRGSARQRRQQHRGGGGHRLRHHRHAVDGDHDGVGAGEQAEIRVLPVRVAVPHQCANGPSTRRSAATTAGAVRRDAVTRQAHPVRPHHPARRAASASPSAASSRKRPLLPPTSTATSGRGRCARRRPVRARLGQPGRRGAVQRGAGDDDVGAGQPVMPGDDDLVERGGSMRGCWICTTSRPRRRSAANTGAALPPQPIARRLRRRGRAAPRAAARAIAGPASTARAAAAAAGSCAGPAPPPPPGRAPGSACRRGPRPA